MSLRTLSRPMEQVLSQLYREGSVPVGSTHPGTRSALWARKLVSIQVSERGSTVALTDVGHIVASLIADRDMARYYLTLADS